MTDDWFYYTMERIDAAPIRTSPWPVEHFKVDWVFPKAFYEELVERLPPYDECVATLKPWRFFYNFTVKGGDPFWLNVFERLGTLKGLIAEKFAALGPSKSEVCIIRDKPGNVLGPHTDVGPKVATGLFYLPKDDSGAEHGTSLFISKSGRTDDGNYDYDFSEDFEQVDMVPYLPNTAFFFRKTNSSWHAARETTIERSLICYELNPWTSQS